MRKKNLNPTVADLFDKKKKTIDRIDFLKEVSSEMKRTGTYPMLPFGGIVNDLFLLNPEHTKVLIPIVLKCYEKELKLIEKSINAQN